MTLITSLTMPRTAMAVLMICGAGLVLGGCSDFRKAIGEEKSSPDEFEVVVRPPLSLPPSFTASSAELLAAADAANIESSTDARSVAAASLGSVVGSSEGGYEALFDFASVPDNIRETVDEETYGIQFERRLPIQMLFGGLPDIGPVLDQFAEDQRLRKNLREGMFPTDGGTPAIDLQSDEPLTIGE